MFSLARRSGHAFGLLVAEEARQNGWLTRLEHAVERDDVVAVRPGVYLPARRWRSLSGADRTLARIYAVALTTPDAVFAFHSAAALYRLPLPGDEIADVHVLGGEPAEGLIVHPAASHDGASDIAERFGLRATSPVQTVLDMADVLDYDDALALVRAAIHPAPGTRFDEPPLCTRAELLDAAQAVARRTGDERPLTVAQAAESDRLAA